MKVIVSSKNPVKISSTLQGFEHVFPNDKITVEGVSVDSGVGDQPTTNDATLLGALNRASNAQKKYLDADYWVGIEGGVELGTKSTESFAWIVINSKNHVSKSRSASFELPQPVTDQLNQGKELGDAMDYLHNRANSKQQEGAVGILTNGRITRTDLYVQPIILALIPFTQK